MLALLLSIFASVLVGQFLRLAAHLELDRFPLFSVNYAVAVTLGLLLSRTGATSEPPAAIVLAVVIGVFYVVGFLVFHRAIAENGTGVAATVSRLSVIIPILLSVIAFGETLGAAGGIGVAVGILALPFSGRQVPFSKRAIESRRVITASGLLWALALFLVFGLNDSALKVRTELLASSDAGIFFAVLFATAMIISIAIALARRERYEVRTLLVGIPLGAVNYGTAYFLSAALEVIPGYVAFTLNSVGIILISVIAGRVVWNERLEPHNYLFFAAGIIAIILVSGLGPRQ
jgi:drug/metabolite transporter (DMT)-like permease